MAETVQVNFIQLILVVENQTAEDAREVFSAKREICFMNVKHRWYLHTYKNVKERVNAINFA